MTTKRAAAFLDKGGTGKTTTVAHLAVALEDQGHDVLCIDLAGKQGDLAKHLGVYDDYKQLIEADDAWPNIATVFDDSWDTIAEKVPTATEDLIHETAEGPSLIPAHPNLDSLDDDLGSIDDVRDRYGRLGTFLDDYIDPLGFDIVLIDLPGLTNNVSYNGLWAARHVIAPVEMGPFEAEQADALRDDLARIAEVFDIEIQLALVLPNKVDTRTRLADEYLDAFAGEYPEAIAPAYVPYSQDIRNATEEGTTAFGLEQPSKTARQAREAYQDAAAHLVQRIGGDA